VSRFLTPGARRIEVQGPGLPELRFAGFFDPMGQVTLVIWNSAKSAIKFQVRREYGAFSYELAANEAVTFSWQEIFRDESRTLAFAGPGTHK
jgi:hypothetical protein